MNKKLSKLLFFLSEDARMTTKALSKHINSSQQSASYMVNQLKKKKIIKKFNSIVDPIKLGFTNIIVGINFLVFDAKTRREIINELKKTDSIVGIQESRQGVDLILEYSINNLSAFNKLHSEISHKFHRNIETKFIFPVVVKHLYPKRYLTNKKNTSEIVICGDREIRRLSDNEMRILSELINNPIVTFAKLSEKTGFATKTIVNIKKKLEKTKIIRGYDVVFDYQKLGINRQLIFLKLSGLGIGEINKLVSHCNMHKNIVAAIKIIGNYQLFITVESLDKINLINELRTEFLIKDYLIVDIDSVIKKNYVPEKF